MGLKEGSEADKIWMDFKFLIKFPIGLTAWILLHLIFIYVTGFVKIDPNHTGTEIHFIAEH